jgi:hypothetical protein
MLLDMNRKLRADSSLGRFAIRLPKPAVQDASRDLLVVERLPGVDENLMNSVERTPPYPVTPDQGL